MNLYFMHVHRAHMHKNCQSVNRDVRSKSLNYTCPFEITESVLTASITDTNHIYVILETVNRQLIYTHRKTVELIKGYFVLQTVRSNEMHATIHQPSVISAAMSCTRAGLPT